ncbi:MAG: DnaJ domain-containing protein [Cyanobacteria bacterium P01_F01_bin.150]
MNDPSQTYYDVLGISPNASLDDIKQAFRRLARRYHPDLNPNNHQALQKFQEVSRVYQVLSDPTERQKYNQRLFGQEVDECQTLSAQTAVECYQKGLSLSQRGQYEKSIASYTRALARNPVLVDAYNQRGFAYYKMRRISEAFADYGNAIEQSPQNPTSYYYRGLTRFSLGYNDAAIADYTKAIQRDASHGQAYYHRGVAYADVNENRLAMADFWQAREHFLQQGNIRRSNDAHFAYKNIVRQQRPWSMLTHTFFSPGDAFMVLCAVCMNPIGGGIAAFDRLTPQRALSVGLLLGFWFILCFTYSVSTVVSNRYDIGLSFIAEVVGIGCSAFILLMLSSTLGRLLFHKKGHMSSDIFISGVALLPLSAASLWASNTSGALALIFIMMCVGHMVLTLYGECRYILHLKQGFAKLWVPFMIAVSFLPLSMVR